VKIGASLRCATTGSSVNASLWQHCDPEHLFSQATSWDAGDSIFGALTLTHAARYCWTSLQKLITRAVRRQFWYTDDTALSVAKAVARAAASGSIACVACPSLFRALRGAFPAQRAHLLEIDPRFEALGSFSLYDYREPRSIAPELHHAFDIVVADPPYLVHP